jgi:adenylate cyclase
MRLPARQRFRWRCEIVTRTRLHNANFESGENDRAREWIGRALVVGADDPLTQYNVACGYTKLGDIEEALDLLERMLPKVGEEIKMWIKHDSDFEALHGHPRFQRLLKSIT